MLIPFETPANSTSKEAKNSSVSITFPVGPANLPAPAFVKPETAIITLDTTASAAITSAAVVATPSANDTPPIHTPLPATTLPLE